MPRAPILFTSYPGASDDLQVLKKSNHKLSDAFLDFLDRLVFVCNQDVNERNCVSRKTFTAWLKQRGYPASPPVFSRNIDGVLMKAGCIKKKKRQFEGTRHDEYALTDLHKLLDWDFESTSETPASIVAPNPSTGIIGGGQGELLELHDAQLPTTATLIQTLAVAFRFSARDLKTGTKTPSWVRYQFRPNESVSIRAEGIGTTDGSNIATQGDRALLRALCSVIREELQEKFDVGFFKNTHDIEERMRKLMEVEVALRRPFMIDLRAVSLRTKGKADTSSVRSTARALHRIRSTRLFVNASDSATWRKLFHKSSDSMDSQYDLITELEGHNISWDPSNYNVTPPRFIIMTFHSQLMASLLMSNQVFVGHKELYSDWSGLSQALNDWQRAIMGGRDDARGNQTYPATLTSLGKAIFGEVQLEGGGVAPHYNPHQFSRDYLNLAKRAILSPRKVGAPEDGQSSEWTPEKGAVLRFWHYGYWHEIHFDEQKAIEIDRYRRCKTPPNRTAYPAIYISRDIYDPFVGNHSVRNRLEKQRRESAAKRLEDNSNNEIVIDIEKLTSTGWNWKEVLELNFDRNLPREEELVQIFQRFVNYHSDATRGTETTIENWERLLTGYFKKAFELQSPSGSNADSTRSRSLSRDLTDTSWAD